jgi:hypothetical protein
MKRPAGNDVARRLGTTPGNGISRSRSRVPHAALAVALTVVAALAAGATGLARDRLTVAPGPPVEAPPEHVANRGVAGGLAELVRPPEVSPSSASDSSGAGRSDEGEAGRPFRHSRHERFSCLQCHGTGPGHRSLLVRTPADCGACHHDPRQRTVCLDCHSRADLPRTIAVATAFVVAEGAQPRHRPLPFEHARHVRLDCAACHATPMSRVDVAPCAGCHQEHHRPEAACSTCHNAPDPGAHPADAHLGCAASGCHTRHPEPLPMASRTLCLACHEERRDHEPGGRCLGCHMIPGPDAHLAAAPPRGGAAP